MFHRSRWDWQVPKMLASNTKEVNISECIVSQILLRTILSPYNSHVRSRSSKVVKSRKAKLLISVFRCINTRLQAAPKVRQHEGITCDISRVISRREKHKQTHADWNVPRKYDVLLLARNNFTPMCRGEEQPSYLYLYLYLYLYRCSGAERT